MKTALFLVLDQYADWEGSYLSTALNPSEQWEVKTISTEKTIKSIGGFTTIVDYTIDEAPDYDLLVLIGGNSWGVNDEKLDQFVKSAFHNNKFIGAICAAVGYLGKNGFLNDYQHTGNSEYVLKEYENYQPKYKFTEKQAVSDQNLVTANGTGAVEFTDLVLKLVQFDTDENVEKVTYMNKYGFYEYCEKYGNPYE
nr:DJ-1/PfpI family protein [Mammaliicoccus sp. Marseille-Q6498]